MSLTADLSHLQSSGGAEREAALATLEKQLICPICLELFNKPVVILPCQHNLCRKCANELYQPSLFQPRTTMMVNSGRFRCPSCRHEVVLDRHGVFGLQRNLLVENIIDIYKQEVSNSSNIPSPLPPPISPGRVTCSDHEGEKVNIFCVTCQVPTCSLCKVFGAHQTCQVAPLTDVCQQQKDDLRDEVHSLVAANEKVQALIKELEETCRTIEENCKTQKQTVCDKFSRMFSILEERRKAMTEQISSEQEEKTGHAQVLVRCYGDSMEANSKLVQKAVTSMEEPDMAAFVQSSRELITKLMSASSSCPTEALKPGYEKMSHYRYNFRQQERALKSLDFLTAVEDVPEESEVEPQPEEPKEFSLLNAEPEPLPEPPTLNQEPVKEQFPSLLSPPAEPVQADVPEPVPEPSLVPPDVLTGPVGAVLQPETDSSDSTDEGVSLKIERKEEETEKEEVKEVGGEVEGCAASDSVKEGNTCEEEEGMSTLQYEGGEAGSAAADWTGQRGAEGTTDAREDEDEMQVKEDLFYPSWYKPSSWRRVGPVPAEPESRGTDEIVCSPLSAGDSPPDAPHATRATCEPQIEPPWVQDSQILPEQHPPGPALPPLLLPHVPPYLPFPPHQSERQPPPLQCQTMAPEVRPDGQNAGEAVVMEEDEEDMQGWVCLPGGVGQGLVPDEGRLDLEGRISPEEPGPEVDRGGLGINSIRLSDGRGEEKPEEHKEDTLDVKGASELLGREEHEAEAMDDLGRSGERGEVLGKDFSKLEMKNNNSDAVDQDDETLNEASGLEDNKISKEPDDLNPKTSVAENKGKLTSCVSLQVSLVCFYHHRYSHHRPALALSTHLLTWPHLHVHFFSPDC